MANGELSLGWTRRVPSEIQAADAEPLIQRHDSGRQLRLTSHVASYKRVADQPRR